jgi:chromate transport protein ChrA
LRNIARAQTIELAPPRGAAVRRYLGAVIFFVILGVVAAVVATKLTTVASVPSSAFTALHGVEIVAVALIVISTIRLFVKLSARTLYALVIETAGTPFAALVSTERKSVIDLVRMIMDAIDNPEADWNLMVENFHVGDEIHGDKLYGDKIKVAGSQNVGKV